MTLRPLRLPGDVASFLDAISPEQFDYLPFGPFAEGAQWVDHLRRRQLENGWVYWAILPEGADQPRGYFASMRLRPEDGAMELGTVLFGQGLARTRSATEAVYLWLAHGFDRLGYRRLEWKCDAANTRSADAARRFGFTYEGTFRQDKVVRGVNRDTAWFSMLEHEWPARRAGFEAWLEPDNFDDDGRQRLPLDRFRSRSPS